MFVPSLADSVLPGESLNWEATGQRTPLKCLPLPSSGICQGIALNSALLEGVHCSHPATGRSNESKFSTSANKLSSGWEAQSQGIALFSNPALTIKTLMINWFIYDTVSISQLSWELWKERFMSKWDFQIHTYIPIKAALFLSPFVVLLAYACGRRGENRTHTHTHRHCSCCCC